MAKFITSVNQVSLNYIRRNNGNFQQRISHLSFVSEQINQITDGNTLDIIECYWVLLLDETNRLLTIGQVSAAGVRDFNIFCREVLQLGLLSNAYRIMLVRNSTSGYIVANDFDKEIIKKVRRAIKLVNIDWSGYVIISSTEQRLIHPTKKN